MADQQQDLQGQHIVFLNWRDTAHPEGGGSEVYVEQVARGLASRGASVVMLCPRYPGAAKRETKHGVRYRRIGGHLSIYLWAPLMLLTGRLSHRGRRPSLVVEIQNGMPFLAAAYSRCPVLVVVHHVHREQWRIVLGRVGARIGWLLESRVAPFVSRHSRYVTVSDATRTELARLGVAASRVDVIHNGSPEPDAIAPRERAHSPTLVVLGRLVPHKRVEIAIDAVAALSDEIAHLSLDVVGAGYWHDHLVQHAEQVGATDRVNFHGHVSDQRKHDLLGQAWALVLPSVKEGWGLVVVEAGMHETPALGFSMAGGINESIVDGQTGMVVEDFEALVDGLRELMTDPDLRDELGRAARKHALRFTWEQAQEDFSTLVRSITR